MRCRPSITLRKADSTADTSPVMRSAPENLSMKPISISPDLLAISAAIMVPSPGVMVRIPIALRPFPQAPFF